MSVLPDIDRSLPDQGDESPSKTAATPARAEESGKGAGSREPRPGEPPRVRTRLTGAMAPAPDSKPPGERSEPVEEDETTMARAQSRRRAPVLSSLHPEHLSPLAGFFLVAFFFFISLSVWPDDQRNALLGYIVLGSLFGAGASWFWLKADRLDRVQANFLAAILGGLGLVVLYLGAREFDGEVWKVFVGFVLATLGTICFLLAGVVKRL